MIEIAAEAEAEKTRREAKGQADAILLKYQAEAEGIRQVLESKAAGYLSLVQGCNGDPKAAATLLMTEKIEEIAGMAGIELPKYLGEITMAKDDEVEQRQLKARPVLTDSLLGRSVTIQRHPICSRSGCPA